MFSNSVMELYSLNIKYRNSVLLEYLYRVFGLNVLQDHTFTAYEFVGKLSPI